MSNLEKIITTAFYLFWTWRVSSFLYSSYTVTESVTPTTAGSKVKGILLISLMAASMILHVMPLKSSPRLSLANTIVSIPSQFHTILFIHRYVVPNFDSLKVTILIHFMSLLSVIETAYLIYVDWERIE